MGGSFSGWAGWLFGALAALALAVVAFLVLAPAPEAPVPAPAEVAAPEPAPQPAPAPAPQAEAPEPLSPDFDVVRIRPDGEALVAGRAEPGARITLRVEGEAVAAAAADAGANFVAMFSLPPSEVDRVMTLEAVLADGRVLTAPHSVIIEGVELPEVLAEAPDTPPAPVPAPVPGAAAPTVPEVAGAGEQIAAAPEAAPASPQAEAAPEAPAAEAAPEAPAAEAAPAPVQVDTAEAAPEPAAPRILLAGPEGITVLQDPGPAPPLSIDTIAYDESGEVALAGRGTGDETVRIYLDNAEVRTAKVGPDGRWRVPLPGIDTGVYTLRIDSIAPDGGVSSRVETPFMREEPEVLAAAEAKAAEALSQGRTLAAVTIQPGNTLWAIAEDRYGEGMQYVRIFEANRDVIRDPDWIYPGQVFTLPGDGE